MVLSDHSKIISISSVVHFAVNWLLLFHRFDSQLGFDGSLRGVGFRGPSKSFAQYSLVPHFVLGFAKPVGTGPAGYIRFPPENRAYEFVGTVNRPVLPVNRLGFCDSWESLGWRFC
jgi:hypothetical protein